MLPCPQKGEPLWSGAVEQTRKAVSSKVRNVECALQELCSLTQRLCPGPVLESTHPTVPAAHYALFVSSGESLQGVLNHH